MHIRHLSSLHVYTSPIPLSICHLPSLSLSAIKTPLNLTSVPPTLHFYLSISQILATIKSSLVACVLAIWFLGLAHSEQAPPPAMDCSSLILNMADCLSFVSNDSTVRKPEGKCWKGLGSVLETKPECLCEAFKNSAHLGVALNLTRALALPAAYKLSAPPLSECHLSLGPAAAPASPFPSSSPAYSPATNEMAPTPVPGNLGSSLASMSIGSILGVAIGVALLSSL